MLTWYVLPSIFALALKLIICWYGRHSLTTASLWIWMFFLGLFGMNVMELVGFYYLSLDTPANATWKLTLYYLFTEVMLVSLLALSLHNVGKLTSSRVYCIYAYLALIAAPLMIPGAAIIGVENIGYSFTRIAGPYYFVVQLGLLLPLAGTIGISLFYSLTAQSYRERRKSQILFIACAPFLVSILAVILLMQAGFKINGAVLVSFMTNITLLILIYTEHKENQYKFMSVIPKTREYEFIKKLSYLMSDPTIGLHTARELVEKEMINEALMATQGNKAKAAQMLGISRQTLHRRLE